MSDTVVGVVEVLCDKCHGNLYELDFWSRQTACSSCFGTGKIREYVLAEKRKREEGVGL